MIARQPAPIGPDQLAFHRYLDDFSSVDDEQELLQKLAQCTDPLPARYADLLGLPPASTYRDAVQALLASWTIIRPGVF